MRRSLLLCAVVAGCGAPAADQPRIGVAGGQRVGFAGVLLRAGLACEYLSDVEQCDVDALRRYDLVLAATLSRRFEPWTPDAAAALEQYVRDGGRALYELGTRLPGWPLTRLDNVWLWPPMGKHHDFRLVTGLDHPLLRRLPSGKRYTFTGTLHAPRQDPPGALVLARFVQGVGDGDAQDRPAVVAARLGAGQVIALAPELSYHQGNWSPEFDDLLLAAVETLTDGRARRVWAAEPAPAAPVAEGPPPAPPAPGGESRVPAGWTVLGEAAAEGYALPLSRPARLWLERVGEAGVEVVWRDGRLVVGPRGGAPWLTQVLPADAQVVLVRRSESLLVAADGVARGRWALGAPRGDCLAAGDAAGDAAVGGDGLAFQPLEALWFADDFTRAGPLSEPWRVARGLWLTGGAHRNESAIPGFALRARDGVASVGEWFWSDYDVALSIRPRTARVVRVRIGCWGASHWLEAELPVRPGQVRLARVTPGGRRVLGARPGHLPAHQWRRVRLGWHDGRARLALDGDTLLDVPVGDLGPGGVALAAEGGDALCDDVQVGAVPPDLPVIHSPRFDKGRQGLLDRDTWAHPAAAWEADRQPGRLWHVGLLTGDFRLALPVRRDGASRLALWLGPARGGAPRFVLSGAELPDGTRVTLVRQGDQVRLTVGGRERAATALAGPLVLGLQIAGLRLAPAEVELRAAEVDEWQFDRAPTTVWETAGDWAVGSRWPCMPEWGWLHGVGDPLAALWSKRRIVGDMVVHALLGARMRGEYGAREGEPFERLCLTIAGNGRQPRSGYWLELGSGPDGASRLYRRDRHGQKLVASCPRRLTYPREAHNFWADVRLERRGARLAVYFQRRLLLTWTDPQPLADGQVCLWTERNALMTPYVAIYGRAGKLCPVPGEVQRRRQERRDLRAARPAFDPLPALHALRRLVGAEDAG